MAFEGSHDRFQTTCWTLTQALSGAGERPHRAAEALMRRYRPAARAYLRRMRPAAEVAQARARAVDLLSLLALDDRADDPVDVLSIS